MHGVDIETALEWRGRTVVDRNGEKIGTLREIYLDDAERPGWGSIHTGLFGLRQTLAPLTEAQPEGDQLRLPFDRDDVKDAPNVDPEVQLAPEDEERLYRHYGLTSPAGDGQDDRSPGSRDAAAEGGTGAVASGEHDRQADAGSSSPGRAEAAGGRSQAEDDAMTRSEEEVRIGTRRRVRGRVRLKKYVVTDYVEKKIPVKREELRVEREAPGEGDERG